MQILLLEQMVIRNQSLTEVIKDLVTELESIAEELGRTG